MNDIYKVMADVIVIVIATKTEITCMIAFMRRALSVSIGLLFAFINIIQYIIENNT